MKFLPMLHLLPAYLLLPSPERRIVRRSRRRDHLREDCFIGAFLREAGGFVRITAEILYSTRESVDVLDRSLDRKKGGGLKA